MRLNNLIVISTITLLSTSSIAREVDRSHNIICDQKSSLVNLLSKVSEPRQLRNKNLTYRITRYMNRIGCSREKITKNTKVRGAGFYQSYGKERFIFPLFMVVDKTTGHIKYAAEGAPLKRHQDWNLYKARRIGNGLFSEKIIPKSCRVLNKFGYLSKPESVPNEIHVPKNCRNLQYIIR